MTRPSISPPALTIWLLTGTPGTGKTELARGIAKPLHAKIIAEKDLASQKGIGTWNPESQEYDVDLKKLRAALRAQIKKAKTNIIIEGHLSCEFALPVDGVLVLTCPRSTLEKRLRERGYSDLKIEENLFCEDEGYCLERVKTHYKTTPLHAIATNRAKKVICASVVNWIYAQIRIAGGSSRESHSHSTRTRTRRRTRSIR